MNTTIDLINLDKTFRVGFFRRRTVRALQGVSLAVKEGQVFGLLGPNGAGKSTIIKLLLNLLLPTAGTVRVFNRAPGEVAARRQIGYLPENPAPYEYLTGREFVTFTGRLAGLAGKELERSVDDVVAVTGMSTAASLQIRRYSKGMAQRICIAQALVAKPRLLVLDEPTSGLDVLGRQLVREIILKQRSLGTTILLCSHIIPDIEALCDHVAVIVGGRILQQGSVSELLTTDTNEVDIQVDGIESHALDGIAEYRAIGDRFLLRAPEGKLSNVLAALLAKNARVISVQRSHYSLEALFLKTVQESQRTIGSDIQ